ncbi:MAG: succinate dehydrogenase [Chloroflexi bacterium]|jgi:succinate dehydrogenase / fumarate reductase membrane anchor subunit|nr:succinate dehydrogenase [Chloroflexota bacterium]
MAANVTSQAVKKESVRVAQGLEITAWKWMRYSGLLLIPLAWIHVALQDVIVGVHAIDITYVEMRWRLIGWRIFDFLLLAFAFAHGMNGLRQVLFDFVSGENARRRLSWTLLILWLVISLIGAVAIIGGVAIPEN